MLINNINISQFGAKLVKKTLGTSEIIVNKELLKSISSSIILSVDEENAILQCIFLIEADTLQSLEELKSHFVKQLEVSILKFDDLDFYYPCTIQGLSNDYVGIDTTSDKHIGKIECILLSDYKYKTEISENINRLASKTINVSGNKDTPAIVEITPSISLVDLIITGLADDSITIKNLTAGKKIIINGEDGTVLENGINKFGDTDLWEWPRLKAGSNSITVSKNSCDITIKYKPRYI
ncbi:MAG: phage tail protein [Clostridium cadaveris]|uniref:Phage tail protein n=2 Tax=Clostridium cadaveris TaxID=1529 RepID=A0A316LZT1_9CLOT|nr:phage tail domain-containing protein [Clostridium cadaveris]MDM8310842.1 phage tail family protein [Clostridium cadaveris]PWL51757.1 MAG: phage tail protein [Clostridium cadaveris]